MEFSTAVRENVVISVGQRNHHITHKRQFLPNNHTCNYQIPTETSASEVILHYVSWLEAFLQ
jgi:hypothetical protein